MLKGAIAGTWESWVSEIYVPVVGRTVAHSFVCGFFYVYDNYYYYYIVWQYISIFTAIRLHVKQVWMLCGGWLALSAVTIEC